MKINRRWLGNVVNLDGTNILKRATRHYRAQPGRQGPRQAEECQARGGQKAKPQSVWETGQAWARLNQVGSPVSLLSQGKQPLTMGRQDQPDSGSVRHRPGPQRGTMAQDCQAFLETECEPGVGGIPGSGKLTWVHSCWSEIEKGDYEFERPESSRALSVDAFVPEVELRVRILPWGAHSWLTLHSEVSGPTPGERL